MPTDSCVTQENSPQCPDFYFDRDAIEYFNRKNRPVSARARGNK